MSKLATHRYRAVIVSPHLDDAVFSCGGRIAQMVKEGPVLVLNLFTRYLSDVKVRGVVLGEKRYEEEANAAEFLGFESRSLHELDVSFRHPRYKKLGNIFRPPIAEDMEWLPKLRADVFAVLDGLTFQELYVPLGIGWHVDHVLTHMLFEPWGQKDGLMYYEDTPYCCIPHSTRYRLNQLGRYPRASGDRTLTPVAEFQAWWQTSMGYAETALMKNIQPYVVRKVAVPVVAFYLFRLMAGYRSRWGRRPTATLIPRVISINEEIKIKVDAMSLYRSQFQEFFASSEDSMATLKWYSRSIQDAGGAVERYWTITSGAE
jgi:LmbE family N-acetylglucosaminyl deacetylase